MPKFNIPVQSRGRFFALSGDDQLSGESAENPKRTIQAAINAANDITPPPSEFNVTQVTSSQGGVFLESFALFDFMLIDAVNVIASSTDPVTIAMSTISNIEIGSCVNNANGGIAFNIDSIVSTAIEAKFCRANGLGTIAVNVVGVCDDIFVNINQLQVQGVASIGVNYTGTSQSPVDFDFNTVTLEDDDCIFVNWDPLIASDSGTVNVSSITNGGAGTAAFHVKTGSLRVYANDVKAEDCIIIENGATLDIFATTMTGDITVEAGGVLNCSILTHTGNITNNAGIGGINGRIDDKNYGNQAVVGSLVVNLSTKKAKKDFESLGRFDLNTVRDKIDSLRCYISRGKKNDSSTTDVRVIYSNAEDPTDPRNGEIYFTGTIFATTEGERRIDLTSTATPVPIQPATFFQVQGRDLTSKNINFESLTVFFSEAQ